MSSHPNVVGKKARRAFFRSLTPFCHAIMKRFFRDTCWIALHRQSVSFVKINFAFVRRSRNDRATAILILEAEELISSWLFVETTSNIEREMWRLNATLYYPSIYHLLFYWNCIPIIDLILMMLHFDVEFCFICSILIDLILEDCREPCCYISIFGSGKQ